MKDAQALVVNDELDSLLVGDPAAQTILTALYDSFYHKNWTNTLKKEGREILRDLYITMLTATNPAHFDNFLDSVSVSGGFLGRTLIVYEDRKSKINPLIEESDAHEIDLKPLVEMLKVISNYKGQCSFTKQAVGFYRRWYKDFYEKLQTSEIDDETGTAERAGDTVLKLGMILSVNENDSLIIDTPHLEKAIELFYSSSKSSKIMTVGRGKSEDSDKIKVVLGYLLSKPDNSAYRKQLLAANYGNISAAELAQTIDTLEQAGLLEILIDKTEGLMYKLNDKYVSRLKSTPSRVS